MGYEIIDDILNLWANKRNLPLYKVYKEEQVRSFEIVDAKGQRYQIWVDLPDNDGQIGVHVWDFKKKRTDFLSSRSELFETLEEAYKIIEVWSLNKK